MRRMLVVPVAAAVVGVLAGCGGNLPRSLDPDRVASEIAALERKAAEDPTDPWWHFRAGEIRVAANDGPSAERSLRAALALAPDHAPSLSLLSKVYWDAGRHEAAVPLLETARAAGVTSPELAAALALHYEALDRVDEADALASDLEARSSEGPVAGALTYLRLRGDDFLRSADIARRALDADPKSAANHNNLGITLLYAGEPAAARESFLTAAEIDPRLPGPLYNLAIVDRFYFFDDERAQQWFRRYRELADDDPDGLAELLGAKVAVQTAVADSGEGTP